MAGERPLRCGRRYRRIGISCPIRINLDEGFFRGTTNAGVRIIEQLGHRGAAIRAAVRNSRGPPVLAERLTSARGNTRQRNQQRLKVRLPFATETSGRPLSPPAATAPANVEPLDASGPLAGVVEPIPDPNHHGYDEQSVHGCLLWISISVLVPALAGRYSSATGGMAMASR
jgi:hypothetical protein